MSYTNPDVRRHGEAGFSFVELSIVTTLLVLAMGFVATSFQTATRSLQADDLIARAMETLQRSAMHISQFTRPCSITTYRVESTPDDVPLAAAAAGEWIEPTDGEARAAVKFQSASGELSMNAAMLTGERELRLILDDNEVANDIDDDGDGMIDEGRVVLVYDGISVTMARNVETLTFTLTGRVLNMEIRSAARRSDGSLQRFSIKETLYLRNN